MRPNRPHIPSFIQIFKEHRHKTNSHTPLRAYLPSNLQNFLTDIPARLPSTASASLRLLVFGEAVFRETPKDPQEEKTPFVAFSSQFPIFM
jgi:hypothetical protein